MEKTFGSRKNGRRTGQKGRWLWTAAFIFVLAMQLLMLIYYGGKKEGFHEDEYYSFYSTNRTAGLYEPDREWVDRESVRNEFVVLPEEKFNYGMVVEVQSWDVHPPLFYFLLHTVCSFFPGVFSKWLGIGVNIAAFILNFGLLAWLAYMVTGQNKRLTLLLVSAYGFNPIIISGVMFIRMYEWLTVFVLSCACIHVRAVVKKDFGVKKFLLPLAAINFLGFLTQYYYLIFLFFTAAGFCIWKLLSCVERKENGRVLDWGRLKVSVADCVKYGFACAISLALAVICYPASLSHIFRGYRGIGALSEFTDAANTGVRLGFFIDLMNEYLFDGYMLLWLAVIALMGIAVFVMSRGGKERVKAKTDSAERTAFFMLLFAAGGYFFTVSKTALLLYETSNRYQLSIYGIVLLLLITALYMLWSVLIDNYQGQNPLHKKQLSRLGGVILLFMLFMGDIDELVGGKTIFLYSEDKEVMAYAKENVHTPVMILYNDESPYNVWWRSQELMEYDRVYFVSEGNEEQLTDEVICGSDKLIVYAADYDRQEEWLFRILACNPNLSEYRLVSKKSLWSVYEFE
ncbi:MAG: hypothetical protein NC433_02490 [Clostridiales bacterium]|nr:hypothetical protein [Clostridiales bacterium]